MEPLGNRPLVPILEEAADRAWRLSADERRARQANSTFRAASRALVESLDSRLVLTELLDYLNWLVPYDAAFVLMADAAGRMVPAVRREWREGSGPDEEADLVFLARDAAIVGEPVTLQVSGEQRLGLPLPGPGGTPGAAVLIRVGDRAFDEEELRAAEAFAGQAAAAIRNASLYEDLKRADEELMRSYDQTIEALSKALDLRDHDTEGHTLRVAETTIELALAMGIAEEDLVPLRRGALLHDIGKIGIPDSILRKPAPLDAAEQSVMERHPAYAHHFLSSIPFLAPALEIAWCHHERWDGSGYPRRLRGREIPLAARIFAVADVWDALTSDRPYRAAMSAGEALDLIEAKSGSHFDPEVVAVFLGLRRTGPEAVAGGASPC
jgi:putative nucleotidyltransferase with HDIG domain